MPNDGQKVVEPTRSANRVGNQSSDKNRTSTTRGQIRGFVSGKALAAGPDRMHNQLLSTRALWAGTNEKAGNNICR